MSHALRFSRPDEFPDTDAIPVHVISADGADAALAQLGAASRQWAVTHGFSGALGKTCLLPNEAGGIAAVLLGVGTSADRIRKRFAAGAAISDLPKGLYEVASASLEGHPQNLREEIALGYLLAGYRFDRYRKKSGREAALVALAGIDAPHFERLARAEAMVRDLVNTPAQDMGPEELEGAARELAARYKAKISVILGDDLLAQNFPMIHAVGRASPRAPRLIDMTWGEGGPQITLVGKGVCFDTGGLNLKPGSSMGTMKKDMGGAANVLGLAQMIMDAGLKLRLRVLIPAVENAVDGSAFRPSDILTARNGMTVEINNTDAEGRLVLADALALGAEGAPDLMISMATLTGAARVAVGPDLAPFYTDDEGLAAQITAKSPDQFDPVWRMPFHAPYEAMIEPSIADLDNAPSGGMAGSITAALFLRRFTQGAARYCHLDIFAWQQSDAPARPKGGLGQGIRALYAVLSEGV